MSNVIKIETNNQVVNYTDDDWTTLKKEIFPTTTNDETIKLALRYCAANKLDPFKKPVSIISFKGKDQLVFTIQAYRTVAARSGWAGTDAIELGEGSPPEWARCTVYKIIAGNRVPFVGQTVYFREAQRNTPIWRERPITMLQKCAEASALRAAFPEEFADWYIEEELVGEQPPKVNVDTSGLNALREKAGQEPEVIEATIVEDSLEEFKKSIDQCKNVDELKEVAAAMKENSSFSAEQHAEMKAYINIHNGKIKETK